jgi:hypothetical protein
MTARSSLVEATTASGDTTTCPPVARITRIDRGGTPLTRSRVQCAAVNTCRAPTR